MVNLKTVVFNILFIFITCSIYAGGYIRAGETFKATEDVRYFSKSETVNLIQKLDRLDELEKQILIYKQNETLYKEGVELKNKAIDSYKETITFLEFSNKQYKDLVENLKRLNEDKNKSMVELTKMVLEIKTASNRRAKANFFTGFVAPILGAWGLSKIK